MLLWFNAEWQISPSESKPNSLYPSRPEQLACVESAFLQEGEAAGARLVSNTSFVEAAHVASVAFEAGPVKALAPSAFVVTAQSSSIQSLAQREVLQSVSAALSIGAPLAKRRGDECTRLLVRLEDINKQDGELLTQIDDDPLFPPTIDSIAEPDVKCKSTNGESTLACERYNRWGRIPDTLEKAAQITKCIAATLENGRCKIKNMCSFDIQLGWLSSKLSPDRGGSYSSFTDAKGKCKDNFPEKVFTNWVQAEGPA